MSCQKEEEVTQVTTKSSEKMSGGKPSQVKKGLSMMKKPGRRMKK